MADQETFERYALLTTALLLPQVHKRLWLSVVRPRVRIAKATEAVALGSVNLRAYLEVWNLRASGNC